jgi:hypothetical protein
MQHIDLIRRSRRQDGVLELSIFILLFFLVSLMVAALPARAQVYTGSLTGVVSDPSEAAIPGVSVSLVDTVKGFTYTSITDDFGRYVIRNLAPSTYSLKVEAKGFSTYTQTGITLTVQQNATVDVVMRLGATATEVTVAGTAPLLAAQDAVTGQEVNRTFVDNLPLIGRAAYDLTLLAPGVAPIPTVITGFLSGGGNAFYSDGMRNMQSEIIVDGVSTTSLVVGIKNQLYEPSIDDIQEFAVQSNNFGVEIGHSGSTTIVVVTKSGTNQFHGNAYNYFRNQVMDSNYWFSNASNVPLPALRYNDFGGTIGGPIQKDKTFFFVDYEGSRLRTFQSFQAGLPSVAERNGDFSEICGYAGGTFGSNGQCSAASGQLWDPYSGVYDSSRGGPVRGAFIPYNNMATYTSLPTLPGNAILQGTPLQRPTGPGNLIDPVASKMMQYFPLPNANVGTASYNPYTNWYGSGVNVTDTNQLDVRIDHRLGDRMQVNGKYGTNWSPQELAKAWNNVLQPTDLGPSKVFGTTGAFNITRNVGSNTVLTGTYGFTRGGWWVGELAKEYPGYSPVTTLGLPSYIETAGVVASPYINIGDYTMANPGLGSLGNEPWSIGYIARQVHDAIASVDQVRGHHELKAGFEFKAHQENYSLPGADAGGFFGFNRFGMSEYPSSGGGDAMATFLSGVDTSGWGSYSSWYAVAQTSPMYGEYAQDKWHVTDKLTVNLGFRYDLDLATNERHNHMENFDPDLPSPLQVPGMPKLMGGDVFLTPQHRRWAPAYKKEFQPRIGLAYRLTPNTVLRGGYGMFFNVPMYGPGSITMGMDGYTIAETWASSYNYNLATPGPPLSNPWPSGIAPGPGSSEGALTYLGLYPSGFLPSWNKVGNLQAWNLGVQRQLPGGLLIEGNYVANKGTNLPLGGLAENGYWPHLFGPWIEKASSAQITALETPVANPFYGIITDPTSSLSGPTVPQYWLDWPSPQFSNIYMVPPPWAGSNYQALQLRVEKRLSKGLQFLASYTNSKSLDQGSTGNGNSVHYGGGTHLQDPNNLKLERALSAFDLPQTLKLTYVYELPFGRGKQWGTTWSPLLNGILGGWQTNGNWTFNDGFPIPLTQSGGTPLPSYPYQQPNLLSPLHKNSGSNWMQQYFSNPQVVTTSAPFTIGTAPPMIPNVRAPGANNANLSVFKEFSLSSLREGAHLQFRIESFNAFNHPQFSAPNAALNSGSFGIVSSQFNTPREVQLALKLYW